MQPLLEARRVEAGASGAAATAALSARLAGQGKSPRGPAVRLNAPSAELKDLKDRYLAWMAATRYAEPTIKGAHGDLEWLYRYLAREGVGRIADVTPEVLAGYSLWLRTLTARSGLTALSPGHVLHRLHGVKSYFKWLAGNMIVLADPAENLELPKVKSALPKTLLTQDEARRLLDAPDLRSPVGYRDKALLELLYATGIRTRELLRLKVQDFDAKARTIQVRKGKGGRDRVIPVPPVAAGYLREYVEKVRPRFAKGYGMKGQDNGKLFLSWTGARMDAARLKDTLERSAKAAALAKSVTAMVLRHSIASHLLENGMDVRAIQEFLGHERLTTTQVYAKVTLSGLRKHYNRHHPREKRANTTTKGMLRNT